jgi:hypothetical protein
MNIGRLSSLFILFFSRSSLPHSFELGRCVVGRVWAPSKSFEPQREHSSKFLGGTQTLLARPLVLGFSKTKFCFRSASERKIINKISWRIYNNLIISWKVLFSGKSSSWYYYFLCDLKSSKNENNSFSNITQQEEDDNLMRWNVRHLKKIGTEERWMNINQNLGLFMSIKWKN